jgi:tRNA dimethylallyltransferase
VQTIFLVGPTASGKSAVALELAKITGTGSGTASRSAQSLSLGGSGSASATQQVEIVSADSMQVYRGLDIGTAKPTPAERAAVPHHLLDVAEVGEVFDVKRFVTLAEAAIAGIHARGKTALVVGGTGLYVRGLRQGLFDGPGRDPVLRDRLEKLSTTELFAELAEADPETAASIDPHNPRRLVRALEVWHTTGQSIRDLQKEWNGQVAGPIFGILRDRADLVARINRRVAEQMAASWLEEARRLKSDTAAMGYRELRSGLPLPAAVERIKIETRQLAKRQMTWFRREPGLIWLAVAADELPRRTAERILEELKQLEDA